MLFLYLLFYMPTRSNTVLNYLFETDSEKNKASSSAQLKAVRKCYTDRHCTDSVANLNG